MLLSLLIPNSFHRVLARDTRGTEALNFLKSPGVFFRSYEQPILRLSDHIAQYVGSHMNVQIPNLPELDASNNTLINYLRALKYTCYISANQTITSVIKIEDNKFSDIEKSVLLAIKSLGLIRGKHRGDCHKSEGITAIIGWQNGLASKVNRSQTSGTSIAKIWICTHAGWRECCKAILSEL